MSTPNPPGATTPPPGATAADRAADHRAADHAPARDTSGRPNRPSPAARWTVAVLGPGGVGGLLSALLARAGHRVISLGREETAAVLRQEGVTVRSAQFGEFRAEVEAGTELCEPVDVCVIGTKATTLERALDRLPPETLGEAPIVPLLNGVEHPETLRHRYGAKVVPGAIRVESTRVSPGVIEHGSPFTDLTLASTTVPEAQLHRLTGLFHDLGVTTTVPDDPRDEATVLWSKMSFLAPMALLSTRYAEPIGGVRGAHREELLALLAETTAVARACGATVDESAVLRAYETFPAATKSSMQRDAEAGRPLELDAIGGALLRAATRHGIAAPVASRLVKELS